MIIKNSSGEKHQNNISIQKNSFKDNGAGKIVFPNGLTITDNSEQWNGTKYDIPSMNLENYDGMLTANHSMKIEDVIGKTKGVRKVAGRRVIIEEIDFAIDHNALALYTYNMMKAGYIKDFSIETIGPWPGEDGVYHNASLVGLSVVVDGNNKSAKINEITVNSIEQAKQMGLDTSVVQMNYLSDVNFNKQNKEEKDMEFHTILNSRKFAVEIRYKNASGEEVTKILQANESVDVAETEKESVEKQINEAEAPKENVADAVKNAIAPLMEKIAELEKTTFDKAVNEPQFAKANVITKADKFANMHWKSIYNEQIKNAWNWLKAGDSSAEMVVREINKRNLEGLQQAGRVDNSITIADMGNFVINKELLTEIEGVRSDFSALLGVVNFQETLSTQMAWLKRSGDISMSEVEMCDDGANGNLKPISEYEATINTSNLHELAAVTPICNAATRFLAADLLADVAAGYRNDYDRKRAQLVIAKLQGAVDATGYKTAYLGTSATTRLTSFVDALAKVSQNVMDGVWVMNEKTRLEIVRRVIEAGIAGPLALTLTSGDMSPLLGKNYVIVPNELMPTLNSAETKTFTVEGVSVTINQAVFYFKPSTFVGRISGGLQYDLSTDASYEVASVVKSAFQRNELVLRGSFFRGGAIRDNELVSSLYAAGIS